ncbi:putative phosphatase [Spathaspora sp. JA1]|nr:putative phosphatase [Spathaspora sp. JA1]
MTTSTNPPAIVFTDFDGTVTLQDSNDYITDNLGMGYPKRKVINDKILSGETTFRDGFYEMLRSIPNSFDECVEVLLANIKLDPGFKDFYEWCREENIPVIIVSSGMKPIISALLTKLVGEEAMTNIEIISNDVEVISPTKWEIKYKHPETGFGHDKAQSITEYLKVNKVAPGTTLFYCGDGVSDLSAAKETDLLFAKRGKDLIKYCIAEGIPYTEFDDFEEISSKIKVIVKDGGDIKQFHA